MRPILGGLVLVLALGNPHQTPPDATTDHQTPIWVADDVPPHLEPPHHQGHPSALLACLRRVETRGQKDPYRTNTGNGFFGAYQMDLGFWSRYGDPRWPRPDAAPAAMQDLAAMRGLEARGLDPWPTAKRVCRDTV